MRTLHPKKHRMAASIAAAFLSSALFSGAAFAQTGDPINLDSIPIENLVIRVPTGMNITYSPKIALASGNTLPAAAVGTAYSFDFKTKATITHDEAPDLSLATWSLMSPAPSGLNISPGGVLSGTPINEGSYSFEVAAIYKGSKDTQVYVMEVTLEVAVALAAGTPPKGVVGQAYAGFDPRSFIQVSGDPSFNIDAVTWSLKNGSTLPAGLTLNTNTGLISGTPTAAFTGPVTMVATYKGESGEQAYEFAVDMNIVVTLASATLPVATVGQAYEGFDFKTVLSVTGDPDYTSDQAIWELESEDSLPQGMELTSQGLLTGTPIAKQSEGKSFKILSTYKNASGQQIYTIVVGEHALHVKLIEAGVYHTCAITMNDGVKCWGYNHSGQLGDNTTTNRFSPVAVIGLSSGVVGLALGYGHSCALKDTGAVLCWGNNSEGQLGNGSTSQMRSPVQVSGLSSGVTSISAGSSHSCARLTTGRVRCWGLNGYGQLGDGTLMQRYTSVEVNGLSGVTAISAGESHSCAIVSGGAVRCWGRNSYGQIGDGTGTQRTTSVQVSGLTSGVAAISSGHHHTCALLDSGEARCWGYNFYGNIGDGTTTNKYVPTAVIGLGSNVASIANGGYHTCAIMESGGARCWGYNYYGQLGDGTNTNKLVPSPIIEPTSGFKSFTGGIYHTCAHTESGAASCWGYPGQLGDGNIGTLPGTNFPVSVLP